MSQKISQYPITQVLTGEIWLEIIQRQYDDEKYTHHRISPEQLASFATGVKLELGLLTSPHLPIDANGLAALPKKPLGGFFLDMAQVYFADGSFVEVVGVKVVGIDGVYYAKLPEEDLPELEGVVSLVVSYLSDLV